MTAVTVGGSFVLGASRVSPTSTSPSRGSFARRHGTTIGLSVLLLCAVPYGIDGKQDHAPNGAVSGDLVAADRQKNDAESRVTTLERDGYDDRETSLQEREDALAGLETDVTVRWKAIASIEEQIEAPQVTDGTWSVGSDVQPGTDRANGSNGSDILENDIPGGGYPLVTAQNGQAFASARCGMWAKL